METRAHYGLARWLWVAVFAVAALALVAGGYGYYRSETERIRTEKYQEIAAIGKLKVGQIEQWRQERLGDVRRSSKAPFLAQAIQEWLRDQTNTALRAKLQARFDLEQTEKGYADVLLLDTQNRVLLSASTQPHPLSPTAKQVIEQCLANLTPMLSDLYRCPQGMVHIDAVAPILGAEGRPIAVLVLRSDAESLLYPLIQSWPTPSRTAETILVRRAGDDLLFLNDLLHRSDSALSLREPLTRHDLPAVQAVLGKEGMFQGRDYRGVDVLADLRPVAESPWFMVAKVDASEILAEANYRGAIVVLFVALFILLAASVTAYGYRFRQTRLYQDLYRSEREQRAALGEFRTTLYSIGDAVITTDTGGLVKQMNRVAEQLTGWRETDATGKPVDEVFHIVNEETRSKVEDPVARVLREGVVVGLGNHTLLMAKDGTERPIVDSGAPICDDSGFITGVVLVFKDQTQEREAQKALQESEERLRLFIEHAPSALAMFDRTMRYLAVSRRWINDYHLGDRDIVGHSHYEMFPEIPDRWKAVHQRGLEGEVLRADDDCLERTDGAVQWLRWEVRPWYTAQGGIGGIVIFTEDVTARKKAEEALRISEDRYRAIFDNASVGIDMVDAEGRFLQVNNALTQMLGYSRDELLNMTFLDVSHPDDVQLSRQYHDRMAQGEAGPYRVQKRYLKKDGRVVWADAYVSSLRDSTGGYAGTIGVISDITQRVAAEEERERLALAIEQAAEVVEITDVDGNIQYVNPAFEKVTGYTRSEAVGRNPRFLKSGEHDKEFYKQLWDTIKRGQVWSGRLVNKRRDGRLYQEEATISPVRDSSGKIVNFVAVKRDITEHLELSRQLQQAQKMEAVGTLAGGVAHDFNNILQVALGYSELILGDEELPGHYRADVHKILESATRGADLVQRLLIFSRKTEIKPQPLKLNRRINEMRKMLERTIPRMIEIQLFLCENLATIDADSTQMDQVLMNLAVNARDAMPQGGRLIFETANIDLDEEYATAHLGTKPGHYVLLTITDTGAGMDQETLGHIFEPFYTTKGVGEGTGLGLAMVYGIVQQHGGHIRCYSEPGEGTTFKIYFPAVVANEELIETAVKVIPRGGSETILLVDDEELIRDLGSRILSKAGYHVLTANNGRDALELYRVQRERIALVILDLIMPEMDGRQCLEDLLSLNPSIKVVIASGYSANGPTKAALSAGAKGFVGKPYDIRRVLEIVRSVLDERI